MLTTDNLNTTWHVPFIEKIKLIPIFAALAGMLFCSRSITETEPDNNIRKNAVKLDSNEKFSGSFYSESGIDVDYIYISVNDPVMIAGELTSVKGIDSEILFFRKGESVPFKIVNDNKSSLNEKFGPYYISEPGVVIALKPRHPVNNDESKNLKYEFSYRFLTAPIPVETESNDNTESANVIDANGIYGFFNNVISHGDIEKDFYYIDLPENKKYRISAGLSAVREIDAVLRMYAESGEVLLIEDSGIAGEPENIFSYGLNGPGKVYFSVNAKDYKVSEEDYYELKVSVEQYEEKFELEPNNVINKATSIAVSPIFGDFSNSEDVDFYKYFNSSFDTLKYSIEVNAENSQFDLAVEIISLIGSQSLVINDGGPGISEGISNYYLKPLETIYIKVGRVNGHGSGTYTLNTNYSSFEDGYEKEPNNNVKQANSISLEKPVTGFISPKQDQDFYSVKISGQLKIQIELESPPFCQAELSVLDSKGIKTDGKTAASMGDKLVLSSILETNGYIKVACENMDKPGYLAPYKLFLVEDK